MADIDTRNWQTDHLSGAIEDTIVLQYGRDVLAECSDIENDGQVLSTDAKRKRDELTELLASIEENTRKYDPDILDIAERCVRVCKTTVSERAIASEMRDENGGEIETYIRLVRSVRGMIETYADPGNAF